MKNKITQENIAEYIGVSGGFLSEIRSGKKFFGRETACRVSDLTGISFSMLLLADGRRIYRLLELATMEKNNEIIKKTI